LEQVKRIRIPQKFARGIAALKLHETTAIQSAPRRLRFAARADKRRCLRQA
jgi:hypothetical protein